MQYKVDSLRKHTSPRGIRGGPAAISADLVPGCILRVAFASIVLCSIVGPSLKLLTDGDLGPICISVGGGGLGSRGELGGSAIIAIDSSGRFLSAAAAHQGLSIDYSLLLRHGLRNGRRRTVGVEAQHHQHPQRCPLLALKLERSSSVRLHLSTVKSGRSANHITNKGRTTALRLSNNE
jgi:hypothetical protein